MLPCLRVLAHPRASLLLMDNLHCTFFAVMFCFMLDKVFELVLGVTEVMRPTKHKVLEIQWSTNKSNVHLSRNSLTTI